MSAVDPTGTTQPDVASPVTVLGTGAVGTAVARILLRAGRPTTVWNRTPNRVAPLAAEGAATATGPAEAVAASSLTLVTVTAYDAVHAILDELADLEGRTVVVVCTGSPAEAEAAAERVRALGGDYLDAGLQAAPDDIGTSTATILYGGPAAVVDRHRETLGLLSTVRHVGTEPTAAAVMDLALFGVWYDAQLGLLRAFETASQAGIDLVDLAEALATQVGHVASGAAATAEELVAGEFPRGPADLREHLPVLERLVGSRTSSVLGDGGLPAPIERVRRLIDSGRGGEGLTAVVSPDRSPD